MPGATVTRETSHAGQDIIVTVQSGTPLYQAVIALGDSQKEHVGPLPYAAWEEYAEAGRVLAIVNQTAPTVPLAYITYRLPRNEVAIAHLVVATKARGRGLARRLVSHLSAAYADRAGLTLLCRRDFPAHHMWPHLGFVPRGDRPGRGKHGKPLTRWWFDHGHPHLLSWQGAPEHQRPVVLDNNVFLDLNGVPSPHGDVSREILFRVLDGRLELLLTPEVHTEIDRSTPAAGRAHLHSVADSYPSLAVRPDQFAAALGALEAALTTAPASRSSRKALTPRRPQDVSDLRHVAYAAAAGVDLVVTRDEPALARLNHPASTTLGVRLVTPQDLVTLLDEEENAPRYWPAALLGTGYSAEEMGSADQELIDVFLNTGAGERKKDLRTTLRELAAATPNARRLVYRDPGGRPVALLGALEDAGVLRVPVLRIKPGALAASLAAQIVSHLRDLASQLNVRVIRVSDEHLGDLLFAAAERDGYFRDMSGLTALTLPTLTTCRDLPRLLQESLAAAVATSLPDGLVQAARGAKVAEVAAALEHQLRPLRLIDANLPTLLVPIKPHWSSQLFHAPQQLFGPPDHLGISREHVYYRAPRKEGEDPPARILWYASAPSSEVVACSALIQVEQDSADLLWRRNRRLGIYTRDQVSGAANKKSIVRALRIADTEVFDRPVSLATLRRLATLHQRPTLQLISPSPIKPALFAAILKEARA